MLKLSKVAIAFLRLDTDPDEAHPRLLLHRWNNLAALEHLDLQANRLSSSLPSFLCDSSKVPDYCKLFSVGLQSKLRFEASVTVSVNTSDPQLDMTGPEAEERMKHTLCK